MFVGISPENRCADDLANGAGEGVCAASDRCRSGDLNPDGLCAH
jgi:hypothetical protein